jgi:hypothetical protein
VHVATVPPTSSTNVAFGQEATHEPAETKGVAALSHVRHWLLFGPEQVPQEPSHGAQTPCSAVGEPGGAAAAYLPRGVQSATHEELSLENGCVDAQLTHSAAVGPEHVAHSAAHVTHVSAVELDPPEHV